MRLAAVALTNWLGAFALALGIAAYVLARMGTRRDFLSTRGNRRGGLRAGDALDSSFDHRSDAVECAGVRGGLSRRVRNAAAMAGGDGGGIVRFKTGDRAGFPWRLQFALFFAALTCLITLTSAWYGKSIVPQPMRYHLEMEMALAMLAAVATYEVFKHRPRAAMVAGVVLTILLVAPVKTVRRYARAVITTIDISKTSEWKTAEWLNQNWSGERVMVPGSTSFWLTAFSDVPEMDGGFDQGITDRELPVATYGLTAMAGPEWAEYSVLVAESPGRTGGGRDGRGQHGGL